jgi:transcriptional regulator with XRE-family HTH domain
MQLHEKIKSIREDKKLSQGYLAHELGVDQSQYSRREKGEIPFVPDELVKLSKLLGTTIAELFGEEIKVLSIQSQNEGKIGEYVSVPVKLIDQYEFRIKEKEEMLAILRAQIRIKKNK